MAQFFKFVFASCLGTLIAVFASFFLLIIMGAVLGAGEGGIEGDSVLLLDFSNPIPELSGNVATSGFSFESTPATGLHDIVRLLDHAANDGSIEGILIKASATSSLGMVTASTIRDAIQKFRDESDKFVYAYGDFYENTSYLMASAADSIFVNPMGIVDVNGYATMIPFFKGAMDKLGVDMNIFYAGKFKSATEPYRRKNMSEQSRRQTKEYLNDNFNLYLDEVTQSRGISKENLEKLINELNIDNSEDAVNLGIIDGVKHWYQVEDMIRNQLGKKKGRTVSYVTHDEYADSVTLKKGSGKNKVAVIFAEGEVAYANENRGNINEKTYHDIFDKIRKDKRVKAIVLRVNSPGGSAFTSEAILRELSELQKDSVPIVASFGDYAASGGYYIAANADKIVSHPQTLTGSIGVFSMLPNFKKGMEEKLGITFDTVKTHPHAIVASPFLDMNESEKVALQNFTDNMYETFLDRVANGRHKSVAEIDSVGQGRVWTGQRAIEKGLVDELGGLDRAIEIAADLADISEYKLVEYPRIEKEFWEEILTEFNKGANAKFAPKLTPQEKKILGTIEEYRTLMRYNEPLARLPFEMTY